MTDEIDLLEIQLQGGRIRNEKSYALPAKHYGDPSKYCEYDGERRKRLKKNNQKNRQK